MSQKCRLDLLLVERGMAASRQRARALIMAGNVLVDTQPVDKPSTTVPVDAAVTLKREDIPYVSRGGLKLEAILKALQLSITDMVCMDVGASTGGFTDCLLQQGALKVYAVDVGYGQLAWSLRQNRRVIAIERTNIRYMQADRIAEPLDLITIDVSFISLKIVVPAVLQFLKAQGQILALIKPQFEVGKNKVGKGGVVKDQSLQQNVIKDLVAFFSRQDLSCGLVIPSPIKGPKGNQEYLIQLIKN